MVIFTSDANSDEILFQLILLAKISILMQYIILVEFDCDNNFSIDEVNKK